ncbi:hypothetical protein Poli38472_007236 [Pythium oligandrum]|uniref:NADP-dependent oxidoreductase domain-containing protein n=1 Tax=Pythium oligandrum TaxID=41045 RepID=A0A8K1C9D3_PYTOL|nr:hypothetical protein Poli38472_007236 [Pythium oligandrum]|eukprot:TMW59091.1 hypothetical protein Poli38472_007236 [Pythium oligandrum]
MKCRLLGNTGLLVSRFSYDCFTSKECSLTFEQSLTAIEREYKYDVNFVDTAKAHLKGQSQGSLDQTVDELFKWSRDDLVISTKIYLGTETASRPASNNKGLSRKHIIEGTKASLKRLNLDYVDVIFCHRSDPVTPLEETVYAMNYVIGQGWAFFWGTSEWSSHDVHEACEIADRLGLVRPIGSRQSLATSSSA